VLRVLLLELPNRERAIGTALSPGAPLFQHGVSLDMVTRKSFDLTLVGFFAVFMLLAASVNKIED